MSPPEASWLCKQRCRAANNRYYRLAHVGTVVRSRFYINILYEDAGLRSKATLRKQRRRMKLVLMTNQKFTFRFIIKAYIILIQASASKLNRRRLVSETTRAFCSARVICSWGGKNHIASGFFPFQKLKASFSAFKSQSSPIGKCQACLVLQQLLYN